MPTFLPRTTFDHVVGYDGCVGSHLHLVSMLDRAHISEHPHLAGGYSNYQVTAFAWGFIGSAIYIPAFAVRSCMSLGVLPIVFSIGEVLC